jgi:cytosine/adenosine deaminase-related metal-dependent hydrolase
VPLSDHEQRLLEQMERALYQEDPKFASSLRSGRGSVNRKRLLAGVAIVVLGLASVVAGVAIPFAPLGIVGFAAMVGGAYWGWQSSVDRSTPAAEAAGAGAAAAAPRAMPKPRGTANGSFMHRMEDRWRRRKEQGGR